MTLSEYLSQYPTGELVLLAEITTADGQTTYRLSDRPYITEPTDTPANALYAPVIAEGGIPEISQKLPDRWGGLCTASWGDLQLITDQIIQSTGTTVDLTEAGLLRRATIELSVTGPRARVPYADRVILLGGEISEVRGSTDGSVTLSLTDATEQMRVASVPTNKYVAANMPAGFPPKSDGVVRPWLDGYANNVTPVLIDSANLIYEACYRPGWVSPVNTFPYEGGVYVSAHTQNGSGQFTLNNPPVAQITAQCRTPTSDTLTGDEILTHLAAEFPSLGISSVSHAGFRYGGDYGVDCGVFIGSAQRGIEVVDDLLKSIACIGRMGPGGVLHLAALGPLPADWEGTLAQYGAHNSIGDTTWTTIQRQHEYIVYAENRNWTPMEALPGSADRDYLASEGRRRYWPSSYNTSQLPDDNPSPRIVITSASNGYGHYPAGRLYNLLSRAEQITILVVPLHQWGWHQIGDWIEITHTPARYHLITGLTLTSRHGPLAYEVEAIGVRE